VKGIKFAEQPTRGMNVSVVNNYEELLAMLNADQVDVGVMPRIQGLTTIHDSGYTNITEMDGVLETLFLYHYVHKRHTDLVEKLSVVLKQMLLTGEMRRVRQQIKDEVEAGL
jgi:polar amino acid transport system substrate-binding protein